VPRFCAYCGSAVRLLAPVVCPACGAAHWLKASRGGAALVSHEGRLLLVRRAHQPWLGYWCAPAGFCDGPEHPADTAVRETLEEAGVTIRVTGYLGHWVNEYLPGEEGGVEPQHAAVSYYNAVPTEGAAPAPDPREVSEVRWFDVDDLPTELAPPATFPAVLAAWREAARAGRLETPLPDLP
jgi:8-oxo-dGTP diphosphatase